MANMIDSGCISNIFHHNSTDKPVKVQVIDIKRIGNAQAGAPSDRYRLVISDGVYYQQAMLATQLNHFVTNESLKVNGIVELLIASVMEQIGSPTNVEQSPRPMQQQQQQQPQQQQQQQHMMQQPYGGPIVKQQQQQPPALQPTVQMKPEQKPFNPYQQQQQQQQQQLYGNNNVGAGIPRPFYGGANNSAPQALMSSVNTANIRSIASLNPYQSNWTIKARVTNKSDVRTWSNQKGEGKLFNVELLDADGGEIRCTMFNNACDKFYPIFQVDKVYLISKGTLKMANKRFSRLNNDYEITLNADGEVKHVDDDHQIKTQNFDFVPILDLTNRPEGANIDVLGICTHVEASRTILSSKSKKEVTKRDLTIMDNSGASVSLTIWGDNADKYTEEVLANNPVIAVKAARISDFAGKSLSVSFQSQFFVNIDIPEAAALKAWYQANGHNTQVASLTSRGGGGATQRISLTEIKENNLGYGEKPDWFESRATITFFRNEMEKPPYYPACPSANCNRKVQQDDPSGQGYRCVNCNMNYPNFENRYVLSCMICDSTGFTWCSMFNEQAKDILGLSADELAAIVGRGDRAAFDNVFKRANFKHAVFKFRTKAEADNMGGMRVRTNLHSFRPVDFVQESKLLLDAIKAYN